MDYTQHYSTEFVYKMVEQSARYVRNTKGSQYVDERNAWMREARKRGTSTWKLAQLSQLSESTVRGIVKGVR